MPNDIQGHELCPEGMLGRSGADSIARFPEGVRDVEIAVSGNFDFDLQMIDSLLGTCIVGTNCLYDAPCVSETDYCIHYEQMNIYFSGDSSTREKIKINGRLPKAMDFSVYTIGSGTMNLSYSYNAISPCPDPLPGCSNCTAYTGCLQGVPVCDGTCQVQCPAPSTTMYKKDWTPEILGGTVGGAALVGAAGLLGGLGSAKAKAITTTTTSALPLQIFRSVTTVPPHDYHNPIGSAVLSIGDALDRRVKTAPISQHPAAIVIAIVASASGVCLLLCMCLCLWKFRNRSTQTFARSEHYSRELMYDDAVSEDTTQASDSEVTSRVRLVGPMSFTPPVAVPSVPITMQAVQPALVPTASMMISPRSRVPALVPTASRGTFAASAAVILEQDQ
jgi:hypothetical protein